MNKKARRPILYRWVRRVTVWFFAAAVFGTTAAAIVALRYIADPKQMRSMLADAVPRIFPKSRFDVGRVQWQALRGITLKDILLKLEQPDGQLQDILTLHHVRIVPNTKALAGGEIRIPRYAVDGLKLHLHFDRQGRCALFSGEEKKIAFAEPATFEVQHGEVTVSWEGNPRPPVVLSDVEGSVELLPPATARMEFHGKVGTAPWKLAGDCDFEACSATMTSCTVDVVPSSLIRSYLPNTLAVPERIWESIREISIQANGAFHWLKDQRNCSLKFQVESKDTHGKTGPQLAGNIRYDVNRHALSADKCTMTNISAATIGSAIPESMRTQIPNLTSIDGAVSLSATGSVHIDRPKDSLEGVLEITVRDGTWQPPNLAFKLNQINTTATATPKRLKLRDWSCSTGFANFHGSALMEHWDPQQVTVSVFSEHIPFSKEFRESLPQREQEYWGRFQPEGHFDVNGRITWAGAEPKFVGVFKFSDNAITFFKFPYRVTHVSGKAEFHPDGRVSVDLAGTAGQGSATLVGTAVGLGAKDHMHLTLTTQNVAVDDQLRKAFEPLPSSAVSAIQKIKAVGTGQAVAQIRRHSGTTAIRTDVDAELDLRNFSADWFPLALDRVVGKVVVSRDRIEFQNVRGNTSTGMEVTMDGWSQNDGMIRGEEPTKGEQYLLLNFWANQVPLNADVRKALPRTWHRVWDHLRPEGKASLTCRLIRVGETEPRLAFRFDASQAAITPYSFPYRLENISGPIEMRDGVLAWKDLTARHDTTVWRSSSGHVKTNHETGEVHFVDLSTSSLPIDSSLRAAVPEALRAVFDFLSPSKPAENVGIEDFVVTWDTEGRKPPVIEIGSAKASFRQANMMPAIGASDVIGHVVIHGSCVETASLKGNIDLESLKLAGMRATGIRGRINVEGPHLHFENVHGKFYRGDLHVAKLSAKLDRESAYETRISIMNASLKDYVAQVWNAELPLDASVNANLFLNGKSPNINRLGGNGTLDMRDVDLLHLPVLIDQLDFLVNRLPEGRPFDDFHADFDIQGDIIVIRKMDMSNTTMKISLRQSPGWMRLSDGALDLLMVPSFSRRGIRIPFVNDSASFHVGGSLSNPLIEHRPFSGTIGGIKRALTPVRGRQP